MFGIRSISLQATIPNILLTMLRKVLKKLDVMAFGEMHQIMQFTDGPNPMYRFSDIGVDNYGGEMSFFFDHATVKGGDVVFHNIYPSESDEAENQVIPKRFVRMDEMEECGAVVEEHKIETQ